MKKALLTLILMTLPNLGFGLNTLNNSDFNPNLQIPSKFVSSSETESLEWGCPIAEVVDASSSTEAMEKIGRACMEDVRQAAIEKPGVFEVIHVSVVWPDVQVSPEQGGYRMEGTIFLETLVMKGPAK